MLDRVEGHGGFENALGTEGQGPHVTPVKPEAPGPQGGLSEHFGGEIDIPMGPGPPVGQVREDLAGADPRSTTWSPRARVCTRAASRTDRSSGSLSRSSAKAAT